MSSLVRAAGVRGDNDKAGAIGGACNGADETDADNFLDCFGLDVGTAASWEGTERDGGAGNTDAGEDSISLRFLEVDGDSAGPCGFNATAESVPFPDVLPVPVGLAFVERIEGFRGED